MSLHNLIHETHIASSGELEGIKERIIASGFAGTGISIPSNYSLGYNHIWREFNRKCSEFNLTDLVLYPVDAGYRPRAGVVETGALNLPTNSYVQPNGEDFYVQPDGESYYLQPEGGGLVFEEF